MTTEQIIKGFKKTVNPGAPPEKFEQTVIAAMRAEIEKSVHAFVRR